MQGETYKASHSNIVEGASIAHRKVRGYIFQERVGCEQKPYHTYRHIAMIRADNANLMTLALSRLELGEKNGNKKSCNGRFSSAKRYV